MLAMSSLSFDISLIELLLPLATGGCVIAAPPYARADPASFLAVIGEHHPDVLQATPSFWRLALASGWRPAANTRLWCGGEVLTPSLARQLLDGGTQLWNVYGPTEATHWSSAARIEAADSITLGMPIPGLGICLWQRDGKAVSEPGQPAEIVVYGAAWPPATYDGRN